MSFQVQQEPFLEPASSQGQEIDKAWVIDKDMIPHVEIFIGIHNLQTKIDT